MEREMLPVSHKVKLPLICFANALVYKPSKYHCLSTTLTALRLFPDSSIL